MNDKNAELQYLASRLRRIGGHELSEAAGLVSAALSVDYIHPEARHALDTELWGHVTRALDVGNFDASHRQEVDSLELEMAGRVLTYRLARGWLVRGMNAPTNFPSFSDAINAISGRVD